jgi:hypothetical protein
VRTAEELAAWESSGGAAAWKNNGARDGYGGSGRLRRRGIATVAWDSVGELRRRGTAAAAWDSAGELRRCGGEGGEEAAKVRGMAVMADEKKTTTIVRLKRLRSAFHAMTGRGGRLTGRDGAASGQSLVSSWRDQTRLVRDDRTLTESDQSLPGNPTRMTGRGGGGQDRTRWSQHHVWCSVWS